MFRAYEVQSNNVSSINLNCYVITTHMQLQTIKDDTPF